MRPLLHSIIILVGVVLTTPLQAQQSIPDRKPGFTENKGQMTDAAGKPVPFVLFKTEAPGVTFWITETGLTIQTYRIEEREHSAELTAKPRFTVYTERADLELRGARINSEQIVASHPVSGHSDYFLPHCPTGITGVKSFAEVTIKNIYPGIDWVLYRKPDGGLKYDFVVHPEANPSQIRLVYTSKQPIALTNFGQLEIRTEYGTVSEKKPISFYDGKQLETAFVEQGIKTISVNDDSGYETTIGFQVPELINRTSDLIIDPDLVWGTFVSGDYAEGIRALTTTSANDLYATGYSNSSNFPLADPGNGAYFQDSLDEFEDTFIMKFSDSAELLWSTYYGGNSCDYPSQIVLDQQENIFITGETNSFDMPTFDPGNNAFYQFQHGGEFYDGYILKFSPNGNRLWATYFGGENNDEAFGLAIDGQENVYIVGYTQSQAFPLQNSATGGYFQPGTASIGISDAFISKFSNDGVMLWSTYYGGSMGEAAKAIAIDNNDNVFITGTTTSVNFPLQYLAGAYFDPNVGGDYQGFLLKFNANGVRIWGTGFGGMSNEDIFALALDADNRLYVSGITDSPNFPLLNPGNGAFFEDELGGWTDAFISRFSNSGVLQWSTYYGGDYAEGFFSQYPFRTYDKLAIDACGNVTLVFETESHDLPVKKVDSHSFYRQNPSGPTDSYVARFCDSGRLLWGTYFGGNGNDTQPSVEIDRSGNLYVACYSIGSEASNVTYPLLDPGGNAFYSINTSFLAASLLTKFNDNTGSLYIDSVTPVTCNELGAIEMHVRGLCYPLSFYWSNGEETLNTTSEDNSIDQLEVGTYTVTVVGECGQLQETFEVVYDCPPVIPPVPEALSFPNVLTPNGDQLNDVFLPITASGIASYELIILNRWGQEVFQSESINSGWNGITGNVDCNEGVYYWKVVYTTVSGEEHEANGFVTLLR